MQPGDRVLPNNSLITTSLNELVPQFNCLSGSLRANVGKLIGPLGTEITRKPNDPFTVIHGSRTDPGTLLVFSSSNAMETNDNGIYTYHTPDENGDTVDFHFGIYSSLYTGIVFILLYIEQLYIICVSTQFLHNATALSTPSWTTSTLSPVSPTTPHPPMSSGRGMGRGSISTTHTSPARC